MTVMVSNARFVMQVLLLAFLATPAAAAAGDMKMPMPMTDTPADFKPTRSAYTQDHQFLVKLLSVPVPIPFQKYFVLTFAVYDGHNPGKKLSDADLAISAGMRHGMKHGFTHGMASAPRISTKDGVFTVSGMYFTMMGPWTLEVSVSRGGNRGVAYFQLPCCQQ
jgi:hypothetical protein